MQYWRKGRYSVWGVIHSYIERWFHLIPRVVVASINLTLRKFFTRLNCLHLNIFDNIGGLNVDNKHIDHSSCRLKFPFIKYDCIIIIPYIAVCDIDHCLELSLHIVELGSGVLTFRYVFTNTS